MNNQISKSLVLSHTNTFVYIVATAFFAVSLLVALMPTQARAASLTEPQVQAILNLLSSFNADQATVKNTEAALRGKSSEHATSSKPQKDEFERGSSMSSFNKASPFCQIARQLKRGDQDQSVADLQSFLASQGFFTGSSTMFFGPKTEEALKHWQAAQGIATSGTPSTTGWGVLGPKTRSIIARVCNPSSHDDKSMGSTTITQGPAPTCTLTANPTSVAQGGTSTLTWASTNAVYASSASGTKMLPQGSIVVTPAQTTIYHKTVFGPGGQAGCEAIVTVASSTATSSLQASASNFNYLVAYSDSFNENMAAVASVAMVPFQTPIALAIESLANVFYQLGIY